jgi:queuine tRNA-ribosyltransferase
VTVRFEVLARAGAARPGQLTTAHGETGTPVFMPGGSAGTVKAMIPDGAPLDPECRCPEETR